MGATFSAEEKIQKVAEAYALDAIDFAQANFKLTLDWSDKSISKLEEILDALYRDRMIARPPEETVWTFSKMLGSYVGEVFRKNHGATWGFVSMNGENMPGLQASAGSLFWPWGKVHGRLTNGPEDNVWNYYRWLVERDEQSQRPQAPK